METEKSELTDNEKRLIQAAVKAALQDGRPQAHSVAQDIYKATERRLYSLPDLVDKIKDDRENLTEIRSHGLRSRSKSIVLYRRNANYTSPEEMLEAVIQDLEADIAANEYEIETVYHALEAFSDDPFYEAVTGKYIDLYDDEDIADDLGSSITQVATRRARLVKDIAVLLYGAVAV